MRVFRKLIDFIPTWVFENLALIGFLWAIFYWRQMELTEKTFGWAMGIWAAHSIRSHANRKAERAGQPIDWLAEFFSGCLGASIILVAEPQVRELLIPGLLAHIAFVLERFIYRRYLKPLLQSWDRESD